MPVPRRLKCCSQKIGRNAPAVMSHPTLVKSNSSVDTRDLGVFADSGASQHVAHDVSLSGNVHVVEQTTAHLPDRSQVATRQHGTLHMNNGKGNIVSYRAYYIQLLTLHSLTCKRLEKYIISVMFSNHNCTLRTERKMMRKMALFGKQ